MLFEITFPENDVLERPANNFSAFNPTKSFFCLSYYDYSYHILTFPLELHSGHRLRNGRNWSNVDSQPLCNPNPF